jgi:ABC-type bacteriocin/lantibiotic exporter with double-glycine peptidase domain
VSRRFLVPEAIQTSAMDCGPASLKALLEGHGIPASYGRLREACQTDIDGTSIDMIESAAQQLGLDAEQTITPVDHLLAPGVKLRPSLVVVRQPNGMTHFVVVWRRHGGWLQVMDPATGRRWTRAERFLRDVYVHTQEVPAEAWREWAESDEFLKPLRGRMRFCGAGNLADEPLPNRRGSVRSDAAAVRPGAAPSRDCEGAVTADKFQIGRLDAAVRMVESLIASGALPRGQAAASLITALAGGDQEIPERYWSVLPGSTAETLRVRGAVSLPVNGRKPAAESSVSPELAAALAEKPARPIRDLLRMAAKPAFPYMAVVAGLLAAAAGTVIEALLFRGLFDMGHDLTTRPERIGAIAALLTLAAVLLALDFSIARAVLRLGRKLESTLRVRFLAKIPRLGDRYFQSRPISDMAARSHSVHQLRQAPSHAADFLRALCQIALTVAGIGWLYPESAWVSALIGVVSLAIPIAAQPMLAERDLRMRSHAGALSTFYLDAMLGLTAIRAHSAEKALQREQEGLLREWARASLSLQRLVVAIEGLQFTAALALAAWLLWTRLAHGGSAAGMLLLVYWVLSLPSLGEEAAAIAWQYPGLRNHALRLMEPLGAPEEPCGSRTPACSAEDRAGVAGAQITLESVTVRAGGNLILKDVDLQIPAGSQVAIVGASGAGKSSLVGLLLGWHRPADGNVLVDGQRLDAAALAGLRPRIAWIDPQVQIWNRSLFDNLRYGADGEQAMDAILDGADLRPVLQKMPDGLQTTLGEGGALVSGGEGQRVRIGRALSRSDVRLVILDEPARGLDRSRRRAIMDRVRARWEHATLLAISHDISDTRDFPRVLVMEGGRVVEDGAPAELAANRESRYRQLLDAEDAVRHGLWASANWRRISIRQGRVVEEEKRRSRAQSIC